MKDYSNNVILSHHTFSHTPGEIAKNAFYYLQDTGYYTCGNGHRTFRVGMKSILILCTLAGKAFLEYRKKKYTIGSGDIMFINCMDDHVYGPEDDDKWEFSFLHFHGNNSDKLYEIVYNMYGPVIKTEKNNPAEQALEKIIENTETPSKFFESETMALIAELLSEIIKVSASRVGENKNNKTNQVVDRGIDFIRKNHSNRISLEDIALAAYCSKYHFSRIFKKMTGSSPYTYLINYRINASKKKLKLTDKSIAEIAIEVGFDSPSNYSKTFHVLEGITPQMYRKIWIGNP